MNKIIEKMHSQKKLCAIYSNKNEEDSFEVGYIEKIDKTHIIISAISPDGQYDGVVVIRIDDIFQIDYDNIYLKNLEKLSLSTEVEKISVNFEKDALLYGAMEYARNYKVCCTINFENYSISGYLTDFIDDCVIMNIVDEVGRRDGYTAIIIDDVKYFSFGSLENKKLSSLLVE